MNLTPGIPSDIQQIRHDGFRNVFEYVSLERSPFPNPARPNLWGTETLGGDWNGRMLIVLKDFAPTIDLENRADGRALYSHRPDFRTNKNLVALLQAGGRTMDLFGQTSMSCGLLIASACYLLRVGSGRSGQGIPRGVLARSWPALEYTIANMPELTDIVLCGVEAFDTFRDNGGLRGDRLSIQSNRRPTTWRKFRVHCTTHTQPTAINVRKDPHAAHLTGQQIAEEDWRAICRYAFPS